MPYHDNVGRVVERGIHLGKRVALAFGLSALSAIILGAVVTDNGFVQLLVTFFAAISLWAPILLAILWVERALKKKPAEVVVEAKDVSAVSDGPHWQRLMRAAPDQQERVIGLQRSIERSQLRLAAANLDPEAHDLCILINKRLPDLIDRNLDTLPPDDRGRRSQVGELIDLVDQFARHCGRHGADESAAHDREAEILRRRFEERLAPPPFEGQ